MWIEGRGHVDGQLVVISGPSGSGKSTLLARLMARPDLLLEFSVSETTRPPRAGEVDGRHYYFVDTDRFVRDRAEGKLLEWAEFNRNFYGTPCEPVYDALGAGKTVLLEIEVQGALQVRDRAPCALFVFIRPPTFVELQNRLIGRGSESEETIQRRLCAARRELAESHWYDHQIINDDLDRAEDELARLLRPYHRST
jgi:guanylate kinase